MTLPREDSNMGKNFWLALSLSMIIVVGYPFFMRWVSPPQPPAEVFEQTQEKTAKLFGEQEALPEVPEKSPYALEIPQPPEVFRAQNLFYDMELSTLGGTLTRLWYRGTVFPEKDTATLFYESQANQPGLFGIRLLHDAENLTQQIFKLTRRDEAAGIFEFVHERDGEFRITKTYFFEKDRPVIQLKIAVENLSNRPRHYPLAIDFGLLVDQEDSMSAQHNEAVVWTDKVESADLNRLAKKGFEKTENLAWGGVIKKYFALLVKPFSKTVAFSAHSDREVIEAAMTLEPMTVEAGQVREKEILIYAGPQSYEHLKSFDLGFESILSKGFFGMFKIWILLGLKFFNRFTHNYGLAIILITLVIKGIFAPLTHMSFKSMKKMQVIQPKIKAIQERHKKTPEKMNKEVMELFRRNRVNPMAGCLPMLIQIPVLFAMFRVLPEAIELKGAPFFGWIHDLSQPDQLFQFSFSVPFLGWSALNVLPILMIFSQMGYQKIMPQTSTSPEQAKIFSWMPLFFGFICYNMPSGLVLYWFIQNILSIVQQVFVNRVAVALHHDDKD